MSSTSTLASASTQQQVEITTLVPDKEKLLSDMKAFMSHHEIITAVERKKMKEKEKELQEATAQIKTLSAEIADLKTRLMGAENLWKENANLKQYVFDLTSSLQIKTESHGKLETSLKEKEEKISRLEQDVEKLDEFKQKVKLAQRIFKLPIKNIQINNQSSEVHLAISGPLNEESTNGTENEAGKSEQKYSTRGVHRAKRGKPF